MNLKYFCYANAILLSLASAGTVFAQNNHEAHRAAMEACFQELGLQRPQRGQRPSEEDRQKLKSCLNQKGVTMPERPAAGDRPPRGNERADRESAVVQ